MLRDREPFPANESSGGPVSFLDRWLYNGAVSLSWPFLSYYYFLRRRTDGKYRSNYRSRLGLQSPPCLPPARRIWVHALSVGETLSVIPLIRALKERSPETDLVFSNATETGREIARKRLAPWVSTFFYMPHDFPWLMDDLVKSINPTVFLLVETDVWPNLMEAMERNHVVSILVNGRISRKSFCKMAKFGSLFAPVFRKFDLIFTQSSQDKLRYEALGAPEDKVFAAGNLKLDALSSPDSPSDVASLRRAAGIGEGRPVWIAGSTHEGEEEVLLEVHQKLKSTHPDLLLILAPRQVHRASDIVSLCRRYAFSTALRSRGQSAVGAAVYLLDTLGELSRFYGLADAAFVGGSLAPFGGHNPLEAVAQEKPVFWGPHLSNFREIEASLLDAGCGGRIDSAEELAKALRPCLDDVAFTERMKRSARDFLASNSGCSLPIAQRILALLDTAREGTSKHRSN